MLLPHPFSISIETSLHYFLIDNYLSFGMSLVSIRSVYFLYLILWAVYVCFHVFSVSLLSVYYPYLKPWAVFVWLTTVYFWFIFRIFSVYDLAPVCFLSHSKGEEYLSFIWYHLIFYLISFDFNSIKQILLDCLLAIFFKCPLVWEKYFYYFGL